METKAVPTYLLPFVKKPPSKLHSLEKTLSLNPIVSTYAGNNDYLSHNNTGNRKNKHANRARSNLFYENFNATKYELPTLLDYATLKAYY